MWQDKIPRQFNNVNYEYKKSENNVFDKDKKFGVSQMIMDIGQNATIKDNIDMCWDEDQNIVVDVLKIKFGILIYISLFSTKVITSLNFRRTIFWRRCAIDLKQV